MCGIVGAVGFIPSRELRDRAVKSLTARGPDGDGQWESTLPAVWFGHRRLAIIDVGSAGNQPMAHPERPNIVVTFNGEIYNYKALRTLLEAQGHRFRSKCDTEVLLHAYVAWGEDLVDRIEGMFAFALFDGAARKVILARDGVGQKPLYFRHSKDGLIFASTTDALRHLDASITRLSPTSLCYVLTLGYVPAPHSIWSGVEQVRPGNRVVWQEASALRVERYWAPPDRISGQATNVDDFRDLFRLVCSEHTLADVPVGLFLSGGVDSSSVACAVSEARLPVKCFTLGFSDSKDSETKIAQETVQCLGLSGTSREIGLPTVDELRHAVARTVPEPQGYSALLTMYAIAQQAAAEMKVMLSGDGGDEVFGGYRWYAPRRGWLAQRLAGYVRRLKSGSSMETFAGRSILHAHALSVFRRFLPAEAIDIFAPLAPNFTEEVMLTPLAEHYVVGLPRQNALQRVDLMSFCSGSILAKVDRMAMAHSLEVRAPFLDRRVITWALSREAAPPIRDHQKPILRAYLSGRVPDSVLTHKKQGFSIRGLERYDWGRLVKEIADSRMVKGGLMRADFGKYLDISSSHGRDRAWVLAAVTSWYDYHQSPIA
jgi:asparagine synthase (glutamine-hydrolysing)